MADDDSAPTSPGATPIGRGLERRREQVLRQLLEAQNSGDLSAAVSCFSHPRYELIGTDRVYDGSEAVRTYLAALQSSFPDLRFEVLSLHHAAGAVVGELMMSGTHLGSQGEVEPSGKHFRCRTAVIFLFEDDQLVGVRAYYDSGTIARQLA